MNVNLSRWAVGFLWLLAFGVFGSGMLTAFGVAVETADSVALLVGALPSIFNAFMWAYGPVAQQTQTAQGPLMATPVAYTAPTAHRVTQPAKVPTARPVVPQASHRPATTLVSNVPERYKVEAKFIETVLAVKYGIKARNGDAGITITQAVHTPEYIQYVLTPHASVRTDTLTKPLQALGTDIYGFRSKRYNELDQVSLTVTDQPPGIQVSCTDGPALTWADRVKTTGLQVALGRYWAGLNAIDVQLDFNNSAHAHMAVFGSTGSGKSAILNLVICELAEQYGPDQLEFYIINLESNGQDIYADLPHTRFIASTHDQALACVLYLNRLIEEDRGLTNKIMRILICDEFQIMTTQSPYADEFIKTFINFGQVARKHHTHMVLVTQDPTGDNFPINLYRSMGGVTVAGYVKSEDYISRISPIEGVSQLRGKGDFYISLPGLTTRFHSYFLTFETVLGVIAAQKAKYGHGGRMLPLTLEPEATKRKPVAPDYDEDSLDSVVVPATAAPAEVTLIKRPKRKVGGRDSKLEDDVEALRPYFDEVWDEDKADFKRGTKLKAIRYTCGPDATSGGSYANRAIRAARTLAGLPLDN